MREFDCGAAHAGRDLVAAFVVPAADQHIANAGRAQFAEGDFLRIGRHVTRSWIWRLWSKKRPNSGAHQSEICGFEAVRESKARVRAKCDSPARSNGRADRMAGFDDRPSARLLAGAASRLLEGVLITPSEPTI